MVVEERPPAETVETIRSLKSQRSRHWRLTLATGQPWHAELMALLGGSDIAQHLEVLVAEEDADFDQLLEAGIAAAAGDDVAFAFPGDVWAKDTVDALSVALSDFDMVYADEDRLQPDGRHVSPRLKPDFSPEFTFHADVVGRPLAVGAGIATRLGAGAAKAPEARDHDLALRAIDQATSVGHLPEVLCHRLIPPAAAPTNCPAGREHVAAALARRGEEAVVTEGPTPGTVRILRTPNRVATASIIIPFRDEPRFLRSCFDSVERTRGRISNQYLLVDNGSTQPETMTLLERLSAFPGVHVLHDAGPFNWARLNNSAASHATGDVLVFMNNDIEALASGWLESLCAQAERDEVGAVGARLLYPDRRLQHSGVVLGLGGAAGHLFTGLADSEAGYLAMAVTTRECSAVTGACLVTRRSIFEDHGGFDESLGVDLNDIDYCLRLQTSGLRVVYEPAAELIHHESPSRGTAGDPSDIVRFIERWRDEIRSGDRYLSPHVTRLDSSCALRRSDEDQQWQRWYAGLRGE
jgi:GT2 family glycosyltransferase